MSAPAKIPLSSLPRGELEALAERLLAENDALKQAVAGLKAEVATLKGVKGRPEAKPSGMEKGAGPEPAGTARGAKGSKSARLAVHEDRVVAAADIPAGSRFKGYEDFLVQDLVLRPHVVRLRRERWLTPDGRTITEDGDGRSGLWTRGLLIRRTIADGKLAFFSTWCPAGTEIATLVGVEGHRWAIEDSFETAKTELGLDHNETRSWHGWHRHVSLVMLAFAMLAAIRRLANEGPPPKTAGSMRRPAA